MTDIYELLKKPTLYEEGSSEYWTNPFLTGRILKGHLDESEPGGSKSDSFIENTIRFINRIAPVSRGRKVVDLGCGPGLYCQKLAHRGYAVTGIDISSNSLRYARDEAKKANLQIIYKNENILDWKETEKFDAALSIYHLYGNFNPQDRKKLLHNVYQSLKFGGIFIVDVASKSSFQDFKEEQTWKFVQTNEALPKEVQLGFRQNAIYPDNIGLERTIILIKNQAPMTFNIWHKFYTKKSLLKEVIQAGFSVRGVYSNVCGEEYAKESKEIAVVLEKKPKN